MVIAANSMFLLVLLPVLAVAQKLGPVIIPQTGAQECASKEQLESARQLISVQLLSIVLSRYHIVEQCGDGIWYQLVSVNMSDPLSQCPGDWVEENVEGVRACGRGTISGGCRSLLLSTGEHQYTKVCGRAIGYQYGHPDAFAEGKYGEGLIITYGMPHQHIWAYAAGVREGPGPNGYTYSNCPCSNPPGGSAPTYMGNNWYCESGNPTSGIPITLYPNDPLWDGEDCEGTCCSNGKTPPWFSRKLRGPTTEDIEARICANEHSDTNEDIFVQTFEIYIQ